MAVRGGGSSPPAPKAEVWSWKAHVLIGSEIRTGQGSLSLWEPNHNYPVLKTENSSKGVDQTN